MRIVPSLLFLGAVTGLFAQESFKRLPDLPKGMLLRPRPGPGAKRFVDTTPPATCATEMRRAPLPDLEQRTPILKPSPPDPDRVVNPKSGCPDKLLLLDK